MAGARGRASTSTSPRAARRGWCPACSPRAIFQETAWHLGEYADNPYLSVLHEGERSARPPRRDLVSEVEVDGPQRSRWQTRANLAFCAVELPAGEHEVELSNELNSWRSGLGLCSLGMLGLCGAVVLSRTPRPLPEARERA